MARKRADLSPADYEEIRAIAKAEALRIVRDSTGIVRAGGILSPITRPFVGPVAAGINRSAKILLDSGALDGFIDAKIAELATQRGIQISKPKTKSRQELVFDLAEAGIDILADPVIQEELENLDSALAQEGTSLPGREVIRRSRQFDLQNLLPRFASPSRKVRKKTKNDKNMSKALQEANSKLRKKNGQLRKGKTQKDVMTLAQKLAKKMR